MITDNKIQVWNGTADRTSGGLTRSDLVKKKRGKVVSKAKNDAAKALHPNGLPARAETCQGGFIQFLAPILGSLLSGLLMPSTNSGSGLVPYRQHLSTASFYVDCAMRSGRVIPETVRRAGAAVMAHRGRGGSGLLSMLGIKTPLADIPIIGSILGQAAI